MDILTNEYAIFILVRPLAADLVISPLYDNG